MIAYQTRTNTARITRIVFVLAIFSLLAAISATSNAEIWNTSRVNYVGQWRSDLMTLGSSEVARAATTSGIHTFAVDFTKGKCNDPNIEVLDKGSKYFGKKIRAWFGAYFRVDSSPIYKGIMFATGEVGENTLFLNGIFAKGTKQEILSTIEHGKILRIKLTMKDATPTYLHFLLSGSRASIGRAQQICRSLKPDSQYFH